MTKNHHNSSLLPPDSAYHYAYRFPMNQHFLVGDSVGLLMQSWRAGPGGPKSGGCCRLNNRLLNSTEGNIMKNFLLKLWKDDDGAEMVE